jgi:glutamate synthase domain-containing protein 3
MDIKFLRPHELVVSVDSAEGGVHVVANGSEAKIADSMVRSLHHQGVLKDAGHDLRFSMRPGGNPQRGEFGGVVEAFVGPGGGRVSLVNRFGEAVPVERAGHKTDLSTKLTKITVEKSWSRWVDNALAAIAGLLPQHLATGGEPCRLFGPDDELPEAAEQLVEGVLGSLSSITGEDYRYLAERALPAFAAGGECQRPLALRLLTELRKRVQFADLGGKALSGIEYMTDGGRDAAGWPEGGVYRILEAVPPLHEALVAACAPVPERRSAADGVAARAALAAGVWGRLTAATIDDLSAPLDPRRDVLVIDFAGFESEAFTCDSASRIVSEAVRRGWRNIVGYGFIGGPRYVGTNLADAEGASAEGVVIELYGRESGDFLGALLEGAQIWLYGQGQSHVGMKAASGYLFVGNDALNTCFYAAHGGTLNLWDSGSRFAVAGQNKVCLDDHGTLAPGLKSIHFGMPNEYAFEYLMSGGKNSLHVVMGLAKPDARGELRLRHKPYAAKFFMSGAAAGRVFVFDPERRLDPQQYQGNVVDDIEDQDWKRDLAPFLVEESRRRGLPLRVEGEELLLRLEGEWRRWHFRDAFIQLVPLKVSRKLAKAGVVPPQLAQMADEL